MNPADSLQKNLESLYEAFGVRSVDDRTRIEEIVNKELATKGLSAQVIGFRYRVLALYADPITAGFLAYDTQQIAAAVNKELPDSVDYVKIRCRPLRDWVY